MKYNVTVEKRMYALGTVEIDAENQEQAEKLVQKKIDLGQLQTTAVKWNEPQYEQFSFEVITFED